MDFFDKQAQAQRKTKWLIFYFLMAVVCIIAVMQFVFTELERKHWYDPETLLWVAGGVIAVVAAGSLIKTAELAQGGRVVAQMLGGELVPNNTEDLNERKLLNIVEEMSLASGVPVPEVYLLPDMTINAFAAGHGPGDTAIGITRGAIEQLNRDQLQGVIAHEFSHILHGDMKLNTRLIGLLNGILCLAFLGGFFMRFSGFGGGGSRDSDDERKGASLGTIMMVGGLALYVVGWIGVFFGNLIKAAVSRQREFLADASAVQYTRNPPGISGALWKIGQFQSRLQSPRAEEASHLFFGNGLAESWISAFDTHPPLDQRIRAIDPNFEFKEDQPATTSTPPPIPEAASAWDRGTPAIQPRDALASMLAALPALALTAIRDTSGACANIYSLLLSGDPAMRETQLSQLKADDGLRKEAAQMFEANKAASSDEKITLTDLAIPALRHLSPAQYADFRDNVQRLVTADGKTDLFEFLLQKILFRHLDLYFTKSTGAAVKYKTVVPVLPDIAAVLSAIAFTGNNTPEARDAAYAAGVKTVNTFSFPAQREDGCDFAKIDAALDRLADSAAWIKRMALDACAAAATSDGVVLPEERALLRAISDSLDCPVPSQAITAQ